MGEKDWDVRRPEARAFRWWSLIQHHRDAVGSLMGLLRSSVDALPDPVEPSRRPRRWLGAPMQERASQLAFLDGARGTGKTSVQLSLRRALHSSEGAKTMAEIPDGLAPELEAGVRALRDTAQDIEPHLVWLPSMDMEPLPEGVNALAAILVRLEYVIGEMGQMLPGRRGWLANDSEGEALVSALDSLRRDVVHAWDGGMRQRSPGQDMHSWADEVLGAERARLDINGRLTDLLDHIAWVRRQRGLPNTLFVQVVDDFDLSPSLCVELLRVVRMVTTPRLFFILAGDLEMASDVMHLKALGDGHRLLGHPVGSPQVEARLQRMASSTSANNLRKLVPPRHRVRLRALGVEEALGLRLPDRGLTLEDALDGLSYRVAGGQRSVLDLLRGPWRGPAPETPDVRVYRSFLDFLQAPVRALIDTEAMLQTLFDGATQPPSSVHVARVLAEELRRRIAEASVAEVSPEARGSLMRAAGTLSLSGEVVVSRSVAERTTESGLIQYLLVERHRWMAVAAGALDSAELPTSLGIGFALVHDLVASARPEDQPLEWSPALEELERNHSVGASVQQIGSGTRVQWPSLTWSRIGDSLLFDQLWSRIGALEAPTSHVVLQHWLNAWLAVESGQSPWALTQFSAGNLESTLRASSRGDAAMRRYQVISMLAPEMGWPEPVVADLVTSLELEGFVSNETTAQRVAEIRTERLRVAKAPDHLLRALPLLSAPGRTRYLEEAVKMLDQLAQLFDGTTIVDPATAGDAEPRMVDSREQLEPLASTLYEAALNPDQEFAYEDWRVDLDVVRGHLSLLPTTTKRLAIVLEHNTATLKFVMEQVLPASFGAFNSLAGGRMCPTVETLQRELRWPRFEPFES